jgi:hypothetical protein
MNDKLRIRGMVVGLIIWTLLVIFVIVFMSGCGKQKPLIEPGDVVKKTIVDSVEVLPPHSTIEIDNRYRYFTSDSTEFITTTKYRVGDTITAIYKKN